MDLLTPFDVYHESTEHCFVAGCFVRIGVGHHENEGKPVIPLRLSPPMYRVSGPLCTRLNVRVECVVARNVGRYMAARPHIFHATLYCRSY